MNFKLSITTLISSAYFLTLFIFNMSKNPDILRNLSQSTIYSVILFVILYVLIVYTEFAFNDLKKKESLDAINKIKQLEIEHLENRRKDIQERIEKMDKEILGREKNTSEEVIEDKANEVVYTSGDTELSEMKKETGTQFDPNFNANNISI